MGGTGGPAAGGNSGAIGSLAAAASLGQAEPEGQALAAQAGVAVTAASTAILEQQSTITPDADTKLAFGKSGAGGIGGAFGAGGQNADYAANPGQTGTTVRPSPLRR